MKKLMYGMFLSIVVTSPVYATQIVYFQPNEKKDFYCEIEIRNQDPDEAMFITQNVKVQGFECDGPMRGKLRIKSMDINKYYFKGIGEEEWGAVVLSRYSGSAKINCYTGSGDRKPYPGDRFCPLSSEK